MAERRRLDRVGQQIRTELSALIETGLDDPRIGLVSVTHVHLSKDMRHAKVYVSGLGNDTNRADTLDGLDSANGFLRRQLSLRLPHLQRTPELTFVYDQSVEKGMRIEKLLEHLHDERNS